MISGIVAASLLANAPRTTFVEVPREFRGAWVATVDNIDWPSKKTLSTTQQKAELLAIIKRAKALHLNALVFQVRPTADALYKSRYEPWSEWLTGEQGKAPSPLWDPLEFAIEESHKLGIELHAWFNPYRSWHFKATGKASPSHVSQTHPEVNRKYGRYQWMDPTEPWVQQRSIDVMLDVVKRYDVDGIHMDDYFYPYKEKGPDGKLMDFPDDAQWEKYKAAGGKMDRGDWRRWNVDKFVRNLHAGIKGIKKHVKFGISPFGIYRPGMPKGIEAGVDQYADLYADARKWLVEGWVDYFTPQLYWPITQTRQSYTALLDWWIENNPKGRHLWIGNYTGRVEEGWDPQEVLDQIKETRARSGSTGNVHFSFKTLFGDKKGLTTKLLNGPYKELALPPASPWLAGERPVAPWLAGATLIDTELSFKVEKVPPTAEFLAIVAPDKDRYRIVDIVAARIGTVTIRVSESDRPIVNSFGVISVDHTGQLSSLMPMPAVKEAR